MKASEIKNKLSVSDKAIEENMDFNALRIVLTEEFRKEGTGMDYRQRALDRCVEAKVEFTSEASSINEIIKRYVKIVNPITGNEMESKGYGGNSDGISIEFRDKETGDKIYLRLGHDAFHFEPKA